MYALAKTKPRVWLKLSWIHQKLVPFCQNPLKYVNICCRNFGLLSANRNPYFSRNRNFTETANFGRYQKKKFRTITTVERAREQKQSKVSSVHIAIWCIFLSCLQAKSTKIAGVKSWILLWIRSFISYLDELMYAVSWFRRIVLQV